MATGDQRSDDRSDASVYQSVRLPDWTPKDEAATPLGRRDPSSREPSFERCDESAARGCSPCSRAACCELSARSRSHTRPQTLSLLRASLPAWLLLLSATLAPPLSLRHTSPPQAWPADASGRRALFWGASGLATSAPVAVCRNGLKCENNGVCVASGDKDTCRCPRPVSALQPSFFV